MNKYPKSGRFNLRGKKIKYLSCGCCVVENRTEKVLYNLFLKELGEEILHMGYIDEDEDRYLRWKQYIEDFIPPVSDCCECGNPPKPSFCVFECCAPTQPYAYRCCNKDT